MLLNCGVGKDSWECLGLQENQAWKKSILNIHRRTVAETPILWPPDVQSLPKPTSIKSVMPSNHLILCHPLLLLPPIAPSTRVFSNESTLYMRWPKYWSFSLSPSPSNTQDCSPLGRTGWISLQSKGPARVFSNTTVQKHQFFSAQLSSQSNSHIHTWPLEKL